MPAGVPAWDIRHSSSIPNPGLSGVGDRGSRRCAAAAPVGATAFGGPQVPTLLGRASQELPVEQGYVIANFDLAVPASTALRALHGTVEAIAIAATAAGPMRLEEEAQALAERGLVGDRYAAKAGTFTPRGSTGHGYDLTLIQAEVLDELLLAGDRGKSA
jgi:hypothetical protein